ncbi:uncharacterized protein [Nerophis lumbriciformis]|uniref:uncharacterized protein n=1 Tax=Nerophis lumbriciformis TaxID=546530 RepID=UPI002AE061A9|nr:uncharacterized protein LOC133617217 [Nerophis lumbriciformis]
MSAPADVDAPTGVYAHEPRSIICGLSLLEHEPSSTAWIFAYNCSCCVRLINTNMNTKTVPVSLSTLRQRTSVDVQKRLHHCVAEVQILSLLETIKHTQNQLMAKVNFLTSRLTITPGPEVEMPANIQFPLEQLEAVEAILNEPSNGPTRQRVISSLATIGGQDVKRVTWNILGRVFTDDVSDQINWKGVNNKKAFSRMATKTLLFKPDEVVRASGQDATRTPPSGGVSGTSDR